MYAKPILNRVGLDVESSTCCGALEQVMEKAGMSGTECIRELDDLLCLNIC